MAKIVEEWFVAQGVDTMPWPAHSPDMNPIENFWSMVDEEIARNPPARDQEALRLCVGNILDNFSETHPTYFKELYASIPRRLQAVVESGSLPTKY